MSLKLEKNNILNILSRIFHPKSQKDIVTLSYIKALTLKENHIGFILDLPPEDSPLANPLKEQCQKLLQTEFKDTEIKIAVTISPNKNAYEHEKLPELPIKYKIAVSSAKGGVGKSTTSVNLALSVANMGYKVGLLDADIYGPSIPRMLRIDDRPLSDGKKISPLQNYGIKAMSIGFMLSKEEAVVWRGPMVSSAVQQMIYQVDWGDLDFLFIDLPPGTGDIHLTLTQRLPLTGAIIVSTPQEIALQDSLKGIRMFEKTHIPVLGLIENMSYFICDGCSKKHLIFDHGGAQNQAQKLNIPFLGEIPIEPTIRQTSDNGHPIVLKDEMSEISQIYKEISKKIIESLSFTALK